MIPPTHLMAQRKPYSSNGRCLYCGVTFPEDDLHNEHIIPETLSGKWILNGTCKCCGDKSNSEYEQAVLKSDSIRTMRAFLKLDRKRAKKKGQITMPPMFAAGTASKMKVTKDDYLHPDEGKRYPRLFSMFLLEPATMLTPDAVSIDRRPFKLWYRNIEASAPGPIVLSDSIIIPNAYTMENPILLSADVEGGGRNFSIRMGFPLKKFMRMLAKIAYCYAVAEHGFCAYEHSDIRKLVIGERNDFHNFIGGSLHGDALTYRFLHHLAFSERGDWRTVMIHLFASYRAPAYEVIIGRAK